MPYYSLLQVIGHQWLPQSNTLPMITRLGAEVVGVGRLEEAEEHLLRAGAAEEQILHIAG